MLEPPAALLSDVEMPGASGAELVERARHALPGLPAQLMSASSHEDLRKRHLIGRGAAVLQKPFAVSTLLEVVERLVSRPAPAAASRAKLA